MALKIERYRLVGDYDDAGMQPDEDGEWVSYEDHEDMLYLAERRQDAGEPEKAPDWLVQVRAEATAREARALREGLEQWYDHGAIDKALHEINEMTGQRREAHARAATAETELAEARKKLGSVGWVRDVMTRACPGWQRQFAAHAGDRWAEGDTTADEQLAWVLNRLVDRIKAQDKKTGFEEG